VRRVAEKEEAAERGRELKEGKLKEGELKERREGSVLKLKEGRELVVHKKL